MWLFLSLSMCLLLYNFMLYELSDCFNENKEITSFTFTQFGLDVFVFRVGFIGFCLDDVPDIKVPSAGIFLFSDSI